MNPTDPARLREGKEKAGLATALPWVSQRGEAYQAPGDVGHIWLVMTEDAAPETWQGVAECGFDRPEENGSYIVHAANDYPALARTLERVREVVRLYEEPVPYHQDALNLLTDLKAALAAGSATETEQE